MQQCVFICDDDADILDICRMILETDSLKIVTCRSADSLYDNLSATIPNLILVDNGLAGTSGQELIRNLKQDDRYSSIPILLFSANADIERITTTSGADGYLAKPFDLNDLKKVVENYLR